MNSFLSVLIVAIGVLAAAPLRAEVGEIRVGIQPGLPSLPVIIAEQREFFAQAARKAGLRDLKVTLLRLSGADAVNEALLSESVDASVLGATAFLSAWDKTKGREELRALAPVATLDVTLYTNRREIKSFTDFGEQDRIAVPASASPQAMLMRMAAAKFYGPDKHGRIDRLLVTMPHPDATAALLAGKTITGYVASQPFSMVLSRSNKVHAVITSKEILDGAQATGAVVAAGRKFVDANPTVARVIIAALEDAMAFIASDPGKAADIYMKSESSTVAKEDVVQQLTDGSMVYSMAPSGFMTFARFMAKSGQLKNEPKSWQDVFFPFLHTRSGS
jgi:ABC-type nitrate/sulfonate/bicarbonate transport system substrate-binding protein